MHGSQETTLRSIKFLEHSVNLSECTRVMQIVLIYVCAHDVPPHCYVLVCSTISNSSTSNSRHSTYDLRRSRRSILRIHATLVVACYFASWLARRHDTTFARCAVARALFARCHTTQTLVVRLARPRSRVVRRRGTLPL